MLLAYIAIGFFSSIVYMVLLQRENIRRANGERDEVIDNTLAENGKDIHDDDTRASKNGRYRSVEEARKDKGDEWSGFRYVL